MGSALLSVLFAALLTVGEAAALLGIPPRRVRYWIAQGYLPGVRHMGRAVYLARAELEAFLRDPAARNGPGVPAIGGDEQP